jgi:patatin-like phospholipase
MRSARLGLALFVLGLAVGVPACAPKRACVPAELALSRDLVDLGQPADGHAPVSPGMIREVAAEFRRRGAAAHPEPGRPYHILALSGGGLYGAFGVGILVGWTEAGTRPAFDVVTGISTGSLIATFAFLGPEYDHVLMHYAGGVERKDYLRLRPLAGIPFRDAIFSSGAMARKLAAEITPEVLAAVAREHAAGRRLYVGTSNLDTRRLIIWDMGAIAARGTPEDLELYRTVVLASCSVPGAFPPVRIPVEIDGRCYDELHVDGGANDGVIFRSFMVADLNRAAGRPGAWAPAGSTLYVISNGKLYANPECTKPRIYSILDATAHSLLYGKTRDEFYRIYLNCLETGVDFRLASIPQDLPVGETPGSLDVPLEDQRRIVEAGFRMGRVAPAGEGWRDLPAGTDPSEQALPRAGTRFVTGQRAVVGK